ncbi:peptidase T [Frisingicoccus sp.]|uniref:peptidase T n=1 Tax=Frisingicoccus sp. TaxID=1918627 RepID=UPI002EBFB9D7|nr:peptidase T [Frisingicoccus sp.]
MVIEKFLKYVKIDTQSDETSSTFPSTEKQKNLARILYQELTDLGASDCYMHPEHGYVYAKLPATDGGRCKKTVGFIAHMDTAPDSSGADVKPQIIENYDGKDIILNKELDIVSSPSKYPELLSYIGKSLIVTDGTTLLGADDKAGVAEIMTMAEILLTHPEIPHGPIAIAFTPDEEVGAGVDYFDLDRFGADFAYTVDGGAIGELEYENFNAASAKIQIKGVVVHPGDAKDKMINAASIACQFDTLLPSDERPQYTEGYDGFFHLMEMEGGVEETHLSYIIRDHDKEKFESRKQLMQEITDQLNAQYGEGTVSLTLSDSYYNMKEKIVPDYQFLIDAANESMKEVQIVPKIVPIRGGTDGARLSYMGLPCPNLCTGGHNYHGRYEFICVESMQSIVDFLVRLAQDMYKYCK